MRTAPWESSQHKGPDGDISWHPHNKEGSEHAAEMLKFGNMLLFGRVTYEMMAGFWPSPMALENDPVVANGMNEAEKIVFSRTMKKADWNGTRVVKGDIAEEVRELKAASGKSMTILGSGSVVTQLAEAGLVDEYQFLIAPVAIGEGTPLFQGVSHPVGLKLTSARPFKDGSVLLCYESDKLKA